MSRNHMSVAVWVAAFSTATATEPSPDGPARLAHRLWVVTETVVSRHIDPPTRADMLSASFPNFLAANANVPVPASPDQRAAQVKPEEQLAALIREARPTRGH